MLLTLIKNLKKEGSRAKLIGATIASTLFLYTMRGAIANIGANSVIPYINLIIFNEVIGFIGARIALTIQQEITDFTRPKNIDIEDIENETRAAPTPPEITHERVEKRDHVVGSRKGYDADTELSPGLRRYAHLNNGGRSR
jgi:hypothetical protein